MPDDQNNLQNSANQGQYSSQGQDVSQDSQADEPQFKQGVGQQQISTGGFSPEIISTPAPQESQGSPETGYEQIKQIEQQAENGAESAPEMPLPQEKTKPETTSETREKKEVPSGVKSKYFGYHPPKNIAQDANYIKSNSGRGAKNESKTWLLMFLDRILKKES